MLKLEEKKVLLKKYMKTGLMFEEAQARVNEFHYYIRQIHNKYHNKIPKKDLDQKFREEFERLCQKLESETTKE